MLLNRRSIVSKTNSADILGNDFGEYPPAPLEADNRLSETRVAVKPFGFFRLFSFQTRVFFLVLKACVSDRLSNELLTTDPSLLQQVDASREALKAVLVPVKRTISKLKTKQFKTKLIGGLELFGLVLVATILILPLLVASTYFIFKSTRRSRKYIKAFFFPAKFSAHTIMYSNQIKDEDLDWYVSHEHIHLLQTLYEQNLLQSSEEADLSVPNQNDLLKEPARKGEYGSYIGYLMLRHETEARLHELVLVYYRVANELPLDLNSFLQMLLHFECFVTPLRTEYQKLYEALPHDNIEIIAPRSEHMMRDLQRIVISIKSEEFVKAYLYEALPRMYANLLKYYGDSDASLRMRQSLPSTSLYESMYGSVESASQNTSRGMVRS